MKVEFKLLGGGSFSGLVNATAPVKNTAWHTPLAGSSWIIPTDAAFSSANAPDFATSHYQATFTVPANSGATLNGQSWADNQITQILIDNTGSSIGGNSTLNDPLNYGFDPGPPPVEAGLPLNYSHDVSGLSTVGSHTLDFYVANNDITQPTNPTGIDFCFHVDFSPPASTTWCSPGFWKNHATSPPWPAGYLNITKKYNAFSGSYTHAPFTLPGDPSLLTVISNPSTYKGPATNNVADILSNVVFHTPIGTGVESCPDPKNFPNLPS